ncbi:MAG: RNA polymerase factor sigma-54 [Flavobacteriales bacterium]|nr:RNA polymerase factor sigma-54 [Flavobacteriales bacterium]
MLQQRLQHKLQQKLSPQQIQLMKLLQIPTIALEQRIKEEMESNPALEEGADIEEQDEDLEDEYDEETQDTDDEFDLEDYLQDDEIPSYRLNAKNVGKDIDDKTIPISVAKTFHELLISQLGLQMLNEEEYQIASHLIGSIDDDGYMRREVSAIVDDLAFTQNVIATEEQLEEQLKIVQSFEPPGVGARDLRECLMLQMERKELSDEAELIAFKILECHFDEFTKKHYDKIISKLEIDEDLLKDAMDEILKLNPRPGNSLAESQKPVQHIIPDFVLEKTDGELLLSLNSNNAPELKVSRSYAEMLETYSETKSKAGKEQKDAIMFVKQKIDSARWFIDAIKQRQETLMKTMSAIVDYQKEYFMDGDETKLRPMILKNIAEIVLMDISTVSRVANSKYIDTPYGTFLLKSFFSESMTNEDGEEVSTREIKKILQDFVEDEDKRKPLADEKLAAILKTKGYNIARRTIAKYREQLNIPVARLRKEL